MHRTITRTIGLTVKKKEMDNMLYKNSGLNCLKLIRVINCGINVVIFQTELTPFDIAVMKFAPITSVEIEYSFGFGTNLYHDQTVNHLCLKI